MPIDIAIVIYLLQKLYGKEWCHHAFSLPFTKSDFQVWAQFDMTTEAVSPLVDNLLFRSLADWTIGYQSNSTIPVTWNCPFHSNRTYESPPSEKDPNLLSYIRI